MNNKELTAAIINDFCDRMTVNNEDSITVMIETTDNNGDSVSITLDGCYIWYGYADMSCNCLVTTEAQFYIRAWEIDASDPNAEIYEIDIPKIERHVISEMR